MATLTVKQITGYSGNAIGWDGETVQAVIVADGTPSSLTIDATDVNGLGGYTKLAAGSVIITPDDDYIAFTAPAANGKTTFQKKTTSGGGGGGGETWVTVFDESVTTEGDNPVPAAELVLSSELTANTIRVTFNGQVYECARQTSPLNYYGTDITAATADWSTYPFCIATEEGVEWFLFTETAGTYTVKIEVSEEAGSLSTANLTIVNENSVSCTILAPFQDGSGYTPILTGNVAAGTYKIILGENATSVYASPVRNASGDITYQGVQTINNVIYTEYAVTGDCTITIGEQH